MKKFLAITLAILTFLFALCACGNGKNTEPTEETTVKEPEKIFKDGYYYVVQEDSTAKIVGYKHGEDIEDIEIIKPVEGIVLVLGYSGIAESKIRDLEIKHEGLVIEQIDYRLDLAELSKKLSKK